MLEMTYPVARMRSIMPKIILRYALWTGSDRPTPRGSCGCADEEEDIPERSGVVAKEEIEETEEALLLWCCEGIGSLGLQPGQFYR
jgi:hypothetical protein